jgi:hypothetical protein
MKGGDGASSSASAIRTAFTAGLIGGACIWVYEALVWAGAQQLMPAAAGPNGIGLVFGKAFQQWLSVLASVLGVSVHFRFTMPGGQFSHLPSRWFQRRGWEATVLALFYAVILWIVMHLGIAIASYDHPCADPVAIIGGFMSHFFTVPLALCVKQRLI